MLHLFIAACGVHSFVSELSENYLSNEVVQCS